MANGTGAVAQNRRYTVYDHMDAAGIFTANSANRDSPDYRKAPYPRMLYHPSGATRIMVSSWDEMTPFGAAKRGEQREIINVVVNNAEEESRYLDDGWHHHPAQAIKAGGGTPPEVSPHDSITKLENERERLMAELERMKRLTMSLMANRDPMPETAPTPAPTPRQVNKFTPQEFVETITPLDAQIDESRIDMPKGLDIDLSV